MISKIDLTRRCESHVPGIYDLIGPLNDCNVKLLRFEGVSDWHSHTTQDELLLVLEGELKVRLREGDLQLKAGEMVIIPHETEHLPSALSDEVKLLVIEHCSIP